MSLIIVHPKENALKKHTECALVETLGRSLGEQFKAREIMHDSDYVTYMHNRIEELQLAMLAERISDEIGNAVYQVIPILHQLPFVTEMAFDEVVDAVMRRLS